MYILYVVVSLFYGAARLPPKKPSGVSGTLGKIWYTMMNGFPRMSVETTIDDTKVIIQDPFDGIRFMAKSSSLTAGSIARVISSYFLNNFWVVFFMVLALLIAIVLLIGWLVRQIVNPYRGGLPNPHCMKCCRHPSHKKCATACRIIYLVLAILTLIFCIFAILSATTVAQSMDNTFDSLDTLFEDLVGYIDALSLISNPAGDLLSLLSQVSIPFRSGFRVSEILEHLDSIQLLFDLLNDFHTSFEKRTSDWLVEWQTTFTTFLDTYVAFIDSGYSTPELVDVCTAGRTLLASPSLVPVSFLLSLPILENNALNPTAHRTQIASLLQTTKTKLCDLDTELSQENANLDTLVDLINEFSANVTSDPLETGPILTELAPAMDQQSKGTAFLHSLISNDGSTCQFLWDLNDESADKMNSPTGASSKKANSPHPPTIRPSSHSLSSNQSLSVQSLTPLKRRLLKKQQPSHKPVANAPLDCTSLLSELDSTDPATAELQSICELVNEDIFSTTVTDKINSWNFDWTELETSQNTVTEFQTKINALSSQSNDGLNFLSYQLNGYVLNLLQELEIQSNQLRFSKNVVFESQSTFITTSVTVVVVVNLFLLVTIFVALATAFCSKWWRQDGILCASVFFHLIILLLLATAGFLVAIVANIIVDVYKVVYVDTEVSSLTTLVGTLFDRLTEKTLEWVPTQESSEGIEHLFDHIDVRILPLHTLDASLLTPFLIRTDGDVSAGENPLTRFTAALNESFNSIITNLTSTTSYFGGLSINSDIFSQLTSLIETTEKSTKTYIDQLLAKFTHSAIDSTIYQITDPILVDGGHGLAAWWMCAFVISVLLIVQAIIVMIGRDLWMRIPSIEEIRAANEKLEWRRKKIRKNGFTFMEWWKDTFGKNKVRSTHQKKATVDKGKTDQVELTQF
ncbi:hypothetical protein BLNAU_44 [Blattamonas nauphoetae]|uniref:Plasma membrane fusion protein PRM1 n=1 Tax=Blattamonas nauphoetae TaxID=2049346 RepID=A0ABQ9YMI3_9EUKA|nr:hypothetical protein BLNAU_44 [Blattamonas nauphoetae]